MDLAWGIGAYRVKLRERRLKSTRKEPAQEHLNRPLACEITLRWKRAEMAREDGMGASSTGIKATVVGRT